MICTSSRHLLKFVTYDIYIYIYKSKYVKGYISCMTPLPPLLQTSGLSNSAKNTSQVGPSQPGLLPNWFAAWLKHLGRSHPLTETFCCKENSTDFEFVAPFFQLLCAQIGWGWHELFLAKPRLPRCWGWQRDPQKISASNGRHISTRFKHFTSMAT